MRIFNFNIVILLLLCMFGYGNPAAAGVNTLSLDAGNIAPGSTGTILLNLENEEACYGFQTDLQLPEGLTLTDVTKMSRTENAVLTSNKTPGSERIVLVSMSEPLAGNSGAVCNITFKASETFVGGKVTLSNIKMSNGSTEDVILPSSTTYIGGIGNVGLYIEDFEITAGESKSVGINLSNKGALSGLQTDIYLPAGLTIDLTSLATTDRTSGFKAEGKQNGDYVRVLLYSLDSQTISGTSGAVITFNLKADDDAFGEETINLRNISVSDPMATSIGIPDSQVKVNIVKPRATSVSLTPENVSLKVGETAQFSATVLPENAASKEVVWSVENSAIASVDNTGLVTATGVGTTTLKATSVDDPNVFATAGINVVPTPVSDVVIDFESMGITGDNLTMFVGEIKAIKAKVSPETATVKTLDYGSANPEIASVDAEGNVTAKSVGETTITISATSGAKATLKVTVSPVTASAVKLNVQDMTLLVGQSDKLTATVEPANTTNPDIVWTSSDELIATVSADGTVTAVSVGVATITATCGNVSATCKVAVNPVVASGITLNVEDMTLLVGQSDKLTATVEPANTTNPDITWKSSDEKIATVTADGTVTAISVGVATITATCGNVYATCKVTVNPVQASGITINVEDMTLLVGQSDKLTATVEPDNTTNPDIVWTSSDESIAKVSADGMVTAISVGVATITATCGNVSATCKVTVNPIVASAVKLNVQDMTLLVGQSDKLSATVEPDNTTNPDIVWTSSDELIATVSADGTVTAVSVGVATITATCGNVSATCKVTVNPVVASAVKLNVQDMTLLVGQFDKLSATVEPANTTNPEITWKSSDEKIATVSADGTVTAISVGVVTITATCGEVSATCKVTVNPVPASSIELSVQDITLLIGSTATLTAKVLPENTTYPEIIWSSADPSIVSVDASGTLSALKVGESLITATCGEASATCKVTVSAIAPTSVELNIKDMELFIGQSETLQAIVRPANTTYPTVIWRSDNESVATVSAEGKVTGVKEGTANITASCGDVSAVCKVTVNPIPASNIEIISGNVSLTIGSTMELKAKVSPDNTTHPEVEWLSSDNNIATITTDGIVTGVNVGTAIITAKCGNVSATCTVTVIPVPSEGIVVSPTSVSMLLGETTLLSATVFPETTTDKKIKWSSDNPAIASVSSTGLVTALSLGKAVITAWNGNVHATCEVTVNPVVATSISLNVKDETLFVASSTQLVATVSPANVTDKTITWTSSKPEIATVSDQGTVYGVAVGTTTVTATIGSVSATCQINVVHRIPDMDPAVTTSDRDIKTLSGTPVNMAVYAEGGEPTGWSYVWTKNGQTVSESSELNITAKNDSERVIAETYRVKVENEIDKVIIFSEIYDFVVQIYPAIDPSNEENLVTISTGTGSANKTREGNTITLSVGNPKGGNPNGWEYVWRNAKEEIGRGESIETIAAMSPGTSMGVEESIYKVQLTNYSPDGKIWGQLSAESTLQVYRRPETPLQLLRKGDGKSHTFVVMMPMNDSQLTKLDYKYVYGWTDTDGIDHVIDVTDLRYCRADAEVYDDSSNKFWVYSIWNYSDGSVVSSGRRYLDGRVDESFDGSRFDGSGVSQKMVSTGGSAVYTIGGQYVGTKITNLSPGIYIYKTEVNGVMTTQKLIIH